MAAALRKVAELPVDQLDELIKIWARDVKELSYDIEDVVDDFMLQQRIGDEPTMTFSFRGFSDRAINLFKKAMTNHQIHNVVQKASLISAACYFHFPTLDEYNSLYSPLLYPPCWTDLKVDVEIAEDDDFDKMLGSRLVYP
ncbi:unnamed protein product [Urochloa humidicola]